MSKLHKSIHKSGGNSGTAESGNASSASSSDDFYSILTSKLNNLNIQGGTGITEHESLGGRSGSLRSPLSRQESRQNSMLSVLIDPESSFDGGNVTGSDTNSDSLSNSRDGSSAGTVSKLRMKVYTVPDLIKVLGMSSRESTRSGIGKNEREVLFAHLYRMIISINSDIYMGDIGANDEDFGRLFNLKNNLNLDSGLEDSVEFEWEAWIRCIDAYGCIGVDEVASDVVELVFPMLLKNIGQLQTIKSDEEMSANMIRKIELSIWSFMCLILFIFYDSENHGMLEHVKLFLQFLQNEKIDNWDSITSSCLFMIGVALSLAWESGRNVQDIIEYEVLEMIKLILANNKKKNNSKVTAAVLAGLCFELTTKEDSGEDETEEDDGDDEFLNDEFEAIAKELEILANEGSKKAGKKGKTAKNIFRQVLNTITQTTDSEELDAIAISKSKNINVKTWFTYIRLQVLRFVLGNELSNWLAKSKDIRGMLKMRSVDRSGNSGNDYGFGDDSDDEDTYESGEIGGVLSAGSGDAKSKKDAQKERTKLLNKQRKAKEEERRDE